MYWCVVICLLSNVVTGSFFDKRKKSNKEVLKSWAPDLYGTVKLNSPIVVNKEMDGIITDPIRNYLRALLKNYSLSSTLMMDIIMKYVGQHLSPAPLTLGESLTASLFSSDYRYLVTLSTKTIKVWLLQRGICVRILKAPTIIAAIRISTNGEFIVASEDDCKPSLHLWFPQKKCRLLDYMEEAVHALAISSDNLHIGTVAANGSRVTMWKTKMNNNELVRMWSHSYSYHSELRFGPACEFFNEDTWFCAGHIDVNFIILFSMSDGSPKQRFRYGSGFPFDFFILIPTSSQIFVGDTNDCVSLLDLRRDQHSTQAFITRCREHQLYPLDLRPTSSGLVNCNIAKVIFLMMEQILEFGSPLMFSARWTKEWTIEKLSPCGHYCVLYQRKKQKIQVVSVDELMQSFTFVVKSTV